MSKTKPLSWVIAGLLLLNIVVTVLIFSEITTKIDIPVGFSGETASSTENETLPKTSSEIADQPVAVAGTAPVVVETVETSTESTISNPVMPETSSPDTAPTETVIARVNDTDIGQTLLISYLNRLAPPEQLAQWNTLNDVPKNILMQGINNAALDILLVHLAIGNKLDQNPVIQADIKQTSRSILKSAFLDHLAPSLVSNQDIATQYKTLVTALTGKLEYRASHILLANEKEANIVVEALEQKKKSFEELSRLFSLDEPTALRGGDLGYALEGQLNPQFEEALNDLEIGQYSKPFKTEFGWHIARLEDRRDSQIMSVEQATPIIRQRLEQQAINEYLEDLLDSATIEVMIASNQTAIDSSSTATSVVE